MAKEGLTIDHSTREVGVNGERVKLTRGEMAILGLLLQSGGVPRSEEELRQGSGRGSVKAMISGIRAKLGDGPHRPKLIMTRRGIGYSLPDGRNSNGQNLQEQVFDAVRVTFDPDARVVVVDGRVRYPTPMQWNLLTYAIGHDRQLMRYDDLNFYLWEEADEFGGRLKQLVNSTRVLIEPDPDEPQFLHTVSNRGLVFTRDGKGEGQGEGSEVVQYGCHTVDITWGRLIKDGRRIPLWPSEEGLLEFFALNPRQILSYNRLIEVGLKGSGNRRSLKQFISRLRKKAVGIQIIAVPGEGYMFDP